MVAVLAAAGCLAAAWVLAQRARETTLAAVGAEAVPRAERARGASREALAGLLRELEAQAGAAATAGPIRNLAADPDRATIEDGLKEEPWWQAQRAEFAVSGLVFADASLDALIGPEAAVPPAELVARARSSRTASGVALLRGVPMLVALAVIDLPAGRDAPPLVVLAKRLDGALLKSLSARARVPLALADGKGVLALSGEDAFPLKEAGASVGTHLAASAKWAASAERLSGPLVLWSLAGTEDLVAAAERTAASTALVYWGVAGLLALVALGLGFRSTAPTKTEALLRETASQLEATRQQLARLTPPKTGSELLPGSEATVPRMTPGPLAGPIPLTSEAPSPDGAIFGRYHLLHRLGAGGMGEIYLAVAFGAEGFKRAFVVKRLRAELAREPELVKQFIDEARLGARLVHANIVPVFDFGKVGEDYFLAQEYVAGRDLDHLAARVWERDRAGLSPAVVLHAAHAVLDALGYAHALKDEAGVPMGLVHRDVSPNNVLVSSRGDAKLLDFGIVKATGRVSETKSGVVKGNVNCMSPEQARGLAVDARSDLFSLGLTLFRCLTGESLYGVGTTYDLLVRAGNGPTEADLARIRALPPPFASVLERALQHDPARRFSSAAEFAAALPRVTADAARETSALVGHLFGDELDAEQARIAQVTPPAASHGTRS